MARRRDAAFRNPEAKKRINVVSITFYPSENFRSQVVSFEICLTLAAFELYLRFEVETCTGREALSFFLPFFVGGRGAFFIAPEFEVSLRVFMVDR